MAFDEIVKSIRAELYDRTVSPLMGSFIISWVACNYKFLLVVFSNLDVTKKFALIDSMYPNLLELSWLHPLLTLFLYPSAMSLAYIYLYPIAAKPVFEYAKKRQREIVEIKQKIDKERLLTAEESLRVKNLAFELEANLQKELDRKDHKIERLKAEIEEKKNDPMQLVINTGADDKNTNEENQELPDDFLTILLEIAENNDPTFEEQLIDDHEDHVKTRYILGELENKGYIHGNYSDLGGNTYELEHKGRQYIIEHKSKSNTAPADDIPEPPTSDVAFEEELSEVQIKVLKTIGIKTVREHQILEYFSRNEQIQAKHAINTLTNMGYINDNPAYLSLTPKGIAYLANNSDLN